ncbi:MAG TPA: hypothetical protein VHE34_16845 [Puia sp.]|uniref:hypothetical protein n=1 Tax=Puia sp. TaxID=2045100 RepID=UPI002BFF1F08|nr:hypothetical protein [Puia sp.]HVU96901.1 hypothetical protein [Puia sp.]
MLTKYEYKARYAPMMLIFVPVFFVAGIFSIELKSFLPVALGSVFPTILPFFMAQVGRDRGKKLEPALWLEWGGMPSIQVLRWRDKTINVLTKAALHEKLQRLRPVDVPPTVTIEQNDPAHADTIYEAWSDYARMNTRDTKENPLVFRELMNYGFRRNMLGLKGPAVVVLFLTGGAVYGASAGRRHSFDPLDFPPTFMYAAIGLLLVLLIWLALVNKNWVKLVSFEYAKRLYEAASKLQ